MRLSGYWNENLWRAFLPEVFFVPPLREPWTRHDCLFRFPRYVAPVMLLLGSNVFMTFAWYGHLKFKSTALFAAILVSRGIAFFEYCLAVPANRIGSGVYSGRNSRRCRKSSR